MVLKLKTSSSLLPVHVIDVSVRPSSNKSVVPAPARPRKPHRSNRVWLDKRLRHQGQRDHAGIEIYHRGGGSEFGVVNEPFTIAARSGGVDQLPDGLPQVVLRKGSEMKTPRPVMGATVCQALYRSPETSHSPSSYCAPTTVTGTAPCTVLSEKGRTV
jgi:hypothetical protein